MTPLSKIFPITWWLLIAFLAITSATARAFDTEYTNEQAGVKMKIIGFGQDVPLLRIENNSNHTLAIRNDIYLVISFWDGDEWVKKLPPHPEAGSGPVQKGSDLVTVIAPKTNIEIPLYEFWFSADERTLPWREGISGLPAGKHQVRITTNSRGITVLEMNSSPFTKNFDIPPFVFEIK